MRRGDEVVATGHWGRDQPVEVGEWVKMGGQAGIVRSVGPRLGERELHLIVQLSRDNLPPR